MMSLWHLVWIIPLVGSIGFSWGALLAASKRGEGK